MEEHEIKALRGLAEWHQDPYWSAIARKAADTIERQAKEIDEFNTEANRLVALNRELIRERDTALAEVRPVEAK